MFSRVASIILLFSFLIIGTANKNKVKEPVLETIDLDRRICPFSKYPKEGWQLMSHQIDSGSHGIMGRTTCIVVDEVHDPTLNTVYVGTENSGLWKTKNFNDKLPEWICLTDKTRLPGIGIVDICIDPKNENNLYVATALGVSFEWEYGLGILRTNDGGKTWKESSLTRNNIDLELGVSQRIKMLKSKANGNHKMIALASRAIYTSQDGAITFQKVYELPKLKNKQSYNYFHDLVKHPKSSRIAYASTVDHYGDNGGAKVFVTKNRGKNWTNLDTLIKIEGDEIIRIDLAVTPSKPNELVAYCVGKSNKRAIYVIEKAWTKNPTVKSFNASYGPGSFWMSDIEISRKDPNIIYHGRIRSNVIDLNKAQDGKFTFERHTGESAIHMDKRDYYFVGNAEKEILYCANDGGVAVYEPNEEGDYKWHNKTGKGLVITQFYGLGLSLKMKRLTGGAQDLGGFSYGSGKFHYYVGDGYQSEVDSINQKFYFGFNHKVGSFPARLHSGSTAIPIGRNDLRYEVSAKGILVGAGFATGNRGDQTLKKGLRGNYVFFYDPIKDSYKEIEAYPYQSDSAIISQSDFENGLQRISALAISKSNPNVFYLAGNKKSAGKYRLWRIDNAKEGNEKWSALTKELIYSDYRLAPWQLWQGISALAVDANNENAIWVGYSDNLKAGAQKVAYHPNVNDRSENAKWVFLNYGLPDFPVNHLEQDPKTGYLYAATDVGVYINKNPKDADSRWYCFNKSLPVIKTTDIEIDRNEIYISTYGRGIWKANTLK
ncbi:MAG: hypothetical protein JXQ87_04405 [Bacteroidia bacterium]